MGSDVHAVISSPTWSEAEGEKIETGGGGVRKGDTATGQKVEGSLFFFFFFSTAVQSRLP